MGAFRLTAFASSPRKPSLASANSSGEQRNVQESNLPLLEGVHRVADGLAPTSQMTFQDSGERRARSSAPRGTAPLSRRAADQPAFTLHAEGGGLEPHAGEDAHSFRMRSDSIARSPSRRARMTACVLAVMRRAEVSSPTPGGAHRVQAGAGAPPVHPPSLSRAGVEPARPRGHRVLSAACLPFQPPGRRSAPGESRTRMLISSAGL